MQRLACQTLQKTAYGQLTQTVLRLPHVCLMRSAIQATCGGCAKPSKNNLACRKAAHMRARKQRWDPRHAFASLATSSALLSYTGDKGGGAQRGRGTKKQERPRTPRCQRCTGHISVQASASAMVGCVQPHMRHTVTHADTGGAGQK